MRRARPASAERHAVIAQTHARSGGVCEMAGLVPEVRCAGRLDCHERQARATMPGSHLDTAGTISACRRHHDWIEHHIPEAEALGVRRRSTFELDGRARALR